MAYYHDHSPQEHATYHLLHYQDSLSSSGYHQSYDHGPQEHKVSVSSSGYDLDYNHHFQNYDYGYDSYTHTYPYPNEVNYFAYNYMEPKLIAYEPAACDTGYVSYHTQYSISYPEKDLEFNEPEFEEFDPTPYDGGYDIISVYGKPLPPSDQTCYPRSNPNPNPDQSKPEPIPIPVPLAEPKPKPKPKPDSEPMHVSFRVPLVEHEPEPLHVGVPLAEPKPKLDPEPVHGLLPVPLVEPEPEPEPLHVGVPVAEPLESRKGGEIERGEESYPDYGYNYPWPEYDNGNGIGVGYDYGYGKQVAAIPPCEYNSEVVDLCENIFGSWPCLARIRKQQMRIEDNSRITYPENGYRSPWEDCANYLFRGPSNNQ